MASWVFCNRCFQPPHRKSSFSLTSCGHVYCDSCLRKGKKDECLICQVPCHTVLLSKHTNSNIQTLFLGIDGLCKKYSQETSQISEFQEKHRRRLVAFYREKISQLEESLRKSVLQIKRLQSMRSSQQAAFNTIKTSVSTKPNGYLLLPPNSSLPDRIESMEIDLTPPARKPEMAAGPSRISLISPPQDGRMGSVSCRGSQHLSLTPSHASMTKAIRVPPLQMPYKELSPAPASQLSSRAAQGPSPSLSSSWTGLPRQPISISGLLQRQCAGSASPGGMDSEKMNPFLPSTPANLCSAASPWHVCVPR
ncbi:probable E3 SUMO-protein ligase RNF212 isoform X9 [Peromyscus californicus insignis]|uniref:probable E3 SUMO-protein ligase RNF212 isoform X9 n=1 Tax=Peromyscus californicus insignis TaxID=564181 RepID=UPI0022A73E94|nr:probable E3 SUMO-protein ligase RNF212 isoform X9 [Peromyscus californicus insignis]